MWRKFPAAREELVKRVQDRYGFSREEAEKEVDAWAFFLAVPEPPERPAGNHRDGGPGPYGPGFS